VKIDFCIIGLGNPGEQYKHTRHNIGFLAADKLAEFFTIKQIIEEDKYALAASVYKDKTVALMKPLTYMNLSGQAVTEFLEKYEIRLADIIVIFDDVSLEFGTLRLRPSGSDGGQRGMHSIIYELITDNIPRLRIGIKNEEELTKFKSEERDYLADYVLSEFTDIEKKNLDKVLNAARDAVLCFMDQGIEAAMNGYNRSFL